jgi:gamma-glutamyltranspeptidase/glutathione hydrolase
MSRDFEQPRRSMVMGLNGMAATSHPSATLAAIEVLKDGGNAMDAAIAACAVQCVVEPGMTGIGGDCFALYAPQGGPTIHAFNGAGRSPAATDAAKLRARGLTAIPDNSPHAVTIPGAVDAWCQLAADHGSLPLARLLEPAIAFAQDGFAVAPRVAYDWAECETLLGERAAASASYLLGGSAPAAGTIHYFPELANTLQAIGAQGRRAFYEGAVAAEMVATLRAEGGVHSLEDFAQAGGNYVTPIRTRFRDYHVHECPPPGQGIIALLILNILSMFPGKGDPLDPARLHLEIEAARLAYAVRNAILAEGSPASIDKLLSKDFAADLAARIDPERAATELPSFAGPEHRDTVYLTVVDKDRNVASFINSVFSSFGSGIVAGESGVLLHNRGMSFTLEEGHPNTFAPGRQPMHTIIPGMLTKGDRVQMPFGVMGGHFQAMGHAHLLTKVIDYGLDPQTAIDLPRLFPSHGTATVEAEATLPAASREGLEARGHSLTPADGPIGGAQAIWIDWDEGVLLGASEPRKDGCALGY